MRCEEIRITPKRWSLWFELWRGDWFLRVCLTGFSGGVAVAVTLARIVSCPMVTIDPARVLPRLAGAVPMEAKLGENASHFGGLLARKLNPDPFADDLGSLKELWRLGLK